MVKLVNAIPVPYLSNCFITLYCDTDKKNYHILCKEQTLLLGIYKAQSSGRHEIPSAL